MHDFLDAAFEGHATADAFRHQLLQVVFCVLEVAVFRPFLHGLHRTHAAVRFESTPLVDDGFAGAFFGSGQHRPNHDGVTASCQGFDDVAGVANAAVGDDGDASAFEGGTDFHHGAQLRHSDAGNDAGCANRARTDAHLHGVGTGVNQGEGRFGRGDVAGHDVNASKGFLDVTDGVDHTPAVAVCRVDNDSVHTGVDEGTDPLVCVGSDAHSRGHAKAAVLVLAGIGEFAELDDVPVGNQAHEMAFRVDDGQFFDAMFAQDLLGLGEVASVFGDDEVFARHQLRDRAIRLLLKPQIAVGHDAHQFARRVGDGNAADFVLAHDGEGVSGRGFLVQRDRILDHPALRALDFSDFVGLGRDAHVLVHDPDASIAGNRNRHLAFSHRVHRRTHNGAFQLDVAGKWCVELNVAGKDFRVVGHEEHVVVRESFSQKFVVC